MKTKEEILKEATKRILNINESSPLHDAVMKAMEEYAQEQVKLFCQPAVVGRSEEFFCCKEQIGQRCSRQCLGCFQFENKD